MRLPNLGDLDKEQRRVYGSAPNDGAILVVGAPGTGKTVMALHRASKLKQLGQEPTLIMYNNVLMRFTSGGTGDIEDLDVNTMHKWVHRWWKSAFGNRSSIPTRSGGGRWREIDWNTALLRILEKVTSSPSWITKLHWGHLVVDEGQDFEEGMYQALGMIMKLDAWGEGQAPALTVFADDNQMLQESNNSSTEEIAFRLGIGNDSGRRFLLRRNYRNTQEIAHLARHFQVGHRSGASELPTSRGESPSALFINDEKDLAGIIARKVRSSPGKQIGVIAPGSKRNVSRAINRLRQKLGDGYVVQGYLSGRDDLSHDALDFDSPDTVTVLHTNSSKGLEFDVVFFIKLENLNVNTDGGTGERMVLYVMCSRAREELILVFSGVDSADARPPSLPLLPPRESGLIKYKSQPELKPIINTILRNCPWIDPEIAPG